MAIEEDYLLLPSSSVWSSISIKLSNLSDLLDSFNAKAGEFLLYLEDAAKKVFFLMKSLAISSTFWALLFSSSKAGWPSSSFSYMQASVKLFCMEVN